MYDLSGLAPLATLAARIGTMLRDRGETVAVSESSAGGLVSAALLSIPGASAYFLGGAVVYTRRAGKALLKTSGDWPDVQHGGWVEPGQRTRNDIAHGFGVRTDRPGLAVSSWPDRFLGWLGDEGFLQN